MSETPKLNPEEDDLDKAMKDAAIANLMEVYGLTVGEAEELNRGLQEQNRTAFLLLKVVSWQHDTAAHDCCVLHETRDIHRAQGEVRAYKNVSHIGDGIRGLLSQLYMQ